MTQFIKLSTPFSGGTTVIPNTFFDIYMPQANGDFVKIYLYLLRYLQADKADISISDLADVFDLTDNDVIRALRYWEKEGLIKADSDASGNIANICLYPEGAVSDDGSSDGCPEPGVQSILPDGSAGADSSSPDKNAGTASSVPQTRLSGTDDNSDTSPDDKAAGFGASPEGTEILLVIEQYLGRPLSRTDIEKIVNFHDNLGFSCELIDYLFDYCASNGKKDMRYIEKVALSWAQNNIHSVSDARIETDLHQASSYAIMTELGLGSRRPAPGEMNYIRTWLKDYGFSLEMILESCRRTIMTIHSPSFEYADKILRRWKDAGITTLSQVQEADKQRDERLAASKKSRQGAARTSPRAGSNRFNNFPQRTYDYKELERQLISKNQRNGEG